MTNQYTWRQERQMLEDSYARRLLVEHNIKEVTTQRQAKNGTREFEFPVPAYSKQRLEWFKYKKHNLKDLPRLRLATFESGIGLENKTAVIELTKSIHNINKIKDMCGLTAIMKLLLKNL